MRIIHTLPIALLTCALTVSLTAQASKSSNAKADAEKAAAEKAIAAAELKINEAVAKGDLGAFKSLVAPDAWSVDSNGPMPVSEFEKNFKQFKVEPGWKITDAKVLWIASNSAVHVYKWTGKGTYMGQAISPVVFASTVWHKNGDKWTAIFHQGERRRTGQVIALLDRRLRNHYLTRPANLDRPADVVRWFGAMQAQDYAGAKWAIGLRMRAATDVSIERAIDAGDILRTHVLRPTWHFVAREDLRWMLALSAPRVHASNVFSYRTLELNPRILARSRKAIERALGKGAHLTRAELQSALARAGIAASGLRLGYVMMHAELEAVICSGARRGKQFTYALADQRLPGARSVPRDEALATLTQRYFASHGPATVRDFAWWSGLTMREVRRGIEMAGSGLASAPFDGRMYWFAPAASPRRATSTHLLPNYDEFLIAYKDRQLSVARGAHTHDAFAYHLVIDGRLKGSWTRRPGSHEVHVDVATYEKSSAGEMAAILRAAERYAQFVGLKVNVAVKAPMRNSAMKNSPMTR